MSFSSIPYMIIRGGSSKGIYFKKDDLPTDIKLRDEIILSIVGRDIRQIDGLGGANPLTSKVAIINNSENQDCDIDFLFIQVVVGENRVDSSPNCGNILAGVGAFAIENNMIKIIDDVTSIKVNMLNSNNICELVLQTPNGKLTYEGNAKIDGVPGTSAPIICNYMDVAGSVCGSLFPTGNKKDLINGINVTCIDNGMPVVIINANELGKTGYESCEELSNDSEFRKKLETIRLKVGPLMNLGDVSNRVVPKMTIVSSSKSGRDINTRTFIPHNCHSSIGVLGAVSVASACLYDECVTSDFIKIRNTPIVNIKVEHPSGEFQVELTTTKIDNKLNISKAGLLRTARLISRGEAYPHKEILNNI
ncbi:MAG: 4-oxalomesaconate tautomerase [Arcobacter sp.]|nr:MAG: 4-oxalomesaconate tautomerase [Arcobacter sp.]